MTGFASLHAQDSGSITIGNGGTSGGGTITMTGDPGTITPQPPAPLADAIALQFPGTLADSLNATVVPGSTIVLDLDLYGLGAGAINSFSVTLADTPYLVLEGATSELPSGFYSSLANDTFSGQNVSGVDIPAEMEGSLASQNVLAALTYKVSPDALVGMSLALPSIQSFRFLPSSGGPIPTNKITVQGPLVAAPEPSPLAMVFAAFCGMLVFGQRFWRERSFSSSGG